MPPSLGGAGSLRSNPTKRGELNRKGPVEIFALRGYMLIVGFIRGSH